MRAFLFPTFFAQNCYKILQVLCNFFFCSIYCLLLFFLLEKLIWSCFMDFRVCERLQRDIFGKNLLSGKFATAMAKLSHTVFKLIYNALSFGFLILLLYVFAFSSSVRGRKEKGSSPNNCLNLEKRYFESRNVLLSFFGSSFAAMLANCTLNASGKQCFVTEKSNIYL